MERDCPSTFINDRKTQNTSLFFSFFFSFSNKTYPKWKKIFCPIFFKFSKKEWYADSKSNTGVNCTRVSIRKMSGAICGFPTLIIVLVEWPRMSSRYFPAFLISDDYFELVNSRERLQAFQTFFYIVFYKKKSTSNRNPAFFRLDVGHISGSMKYDNPKMDLNYDIKGRFW